MTISFINRNFFKTIKPRLLLGNEPTAELFGILSVYFIQGILGLVRLAVSFFLKDDLGLSPAQMAALMGLAALPWVVKPIFGLLSDSFPLFGYRRRPYLILSGILGCLSWLAFATVVNSALAAAVVLLITSLSVAISDVIVDSLVVERARQESLSNAGSLQSLTWGVSAFGGLLTAYLSGSLLEHLSTRDIFAITSIFPLVICFVASLISEPRIGSTVPEEKDSSQKINIRGQIQQVWGAFKQKSILLPTLFVFIWQATPSADSAFFYFTTNELGFEPEFLGRVRLVTSLASLLGIFLYQRFLRSISFRKILGWSIVISAVLGMTTLLLVTHVNRSMGIDDHWFSLGDSLILTVSGQIAFMPVLVLSARLCPPGIEATLFALLMSICNVSGLLSHELGALLTQWLGVTETNFEHLWILVILTNCSTLLPLLLIGWLPKGDPQAFAEERQTESLPPVELYEHHAVGSVAEQPFLPEIVPEFVKESVD